MEQVTHHRAHFGLRSPDVLQAASGLELGQNVLMLTGVPSCSRVSGLSIALVR